MRLNLVLITLLITSCSTLYYKSWEMLGKEKRDLLASNLNDLNDDQSDAKEEFTDVLSRIRSEYKFSEGLLEQTYDQMKSDYDDLEEESQEVSERINKVEAIAVDLFEEWSEEADQFENKQYAKSSREQLSRTQKSFKKVSIKARASEKKMKKALSRFKDQVIFLKHNLNARVVSQLAGELKLIEKEMEGLIKEINASIETSKGFVENSLP